MIISLIIHTIFPQTMARPTQAYRALAWMIDAVIVMALVLAGLAALNFWIDVVVPFLNYVRWGN